MSAPFKSETEKLLVKLNVMAKALTVDEGCKIT